MRTIVNTVITGILVKQAKLTYTPKGTAAVYISFPTDIGYYENKRTVWLNAVWFGKAAEEKAPKLVKGTEVVIVAGQGDPKDNSIFYTVKTLDVRKYGEGAAGFEEDTFTGFGDEDLPF